MCRPTRHLQIELVLFLPFQSVHLLLHFLVLLCWLGHPVLWRIRVVRVDAFLCLVLILWGKHLRNSIKQTVNYDVNWRFAAFLHQSEVASLFAESFYHEFMLNSASVDTIL